MSEGVIQAHHKHVIVNLIKYVVDVFRRRVTHGQSVEELVASCSKRLYINSICSSKLNEYLVFHFQAAEGQIRIRRGIVRWKKLGNILFVANLETEINEYDSAKQQRDIHQCLMLLIESVKANEKIIHCP